MPYQINLGEYLSSKWYTFINSPTVQTKKTTNEKYETLGSFSQGTNWEKVFALGDKINRDLGATEQGIIDDIANFRKRRKK
jgi:hypothetical protein